jgi:hypothetical protein
MRGHGVTVTGPTLQEAVYRGVYVDVNARLQLGAIGLGAVDYLTEQEGRAAAAANASQIGRAWEMWRSRLLSAPRLAPEGHRGADLLQEAPPGSSPARGRSRNTSPPPRSVSCLAHDRRIAERIGLALVSTAHAQSVESFYHGRTVTIVVGYSVGDGYDVLARVLGQAHSGQPLCFTSRWTLQIEPDRIASASTSDSAASLR